MLKRAWTLIRTSKNDNILLNIVTTDTLNFCYIAEELFYIHVLHI